MLDLILSIVDELRESFRIVDALDILLVSVFLYATLAWFQRAASRGVFLGLAFLTLVYFLARALDMYLTSLAFHTTFAVLLFSLVVVFQEDLRRLLERVSSFGSLDFGQSQNISLDVDEVVESAFEMATSKTGALIVLKGQEPLQRHLNGGVVLNGHVSKPLLFSIFDSKSPGHDGAVVIEHDQVTEFAAHLPISQNTGAIAGRGTRHSAALGISESSDALTIVVSEEHGDVSVAEGGELSKASTASDLKKRLEVFFQTTFPAASQPLLRRVFVQHVRLKILSFALALTAWFVLAHDPHTVQRTFAVPVEYRNLPTGLEIDGAAPSEARVTLSGSERHFRFLEPSSLKISLDLARTDTGFHEVVVAERNIGLPSNVSLYRIEPRIIRLYIRTREPANP
jgi:diadenylate cyclase